MPELQTAQVAETEVDVNEVPKVTLDLLTGKGENVKRAGGIVTKEDMINIKLYVKHALSLPIKTDVVESYIGYTKAGIAGLEPADIRVLFEGINTHGIGWEAVESKVVTQAINLQGFSNRTVNTGDELLGLIEEWPFFQRIKKLGTVTDKTLEQIGFGPEDPEASLALGEYLEMLKNDIESQRIKTKAVKVAVSDYKITLAGGELSNGTPTAGLGPEVDKKYKLMQDNNLAQKIKDDEDDIKAKEDRIAQLCKDYDLYVGLAFTGAVFGVVGVAITGGIFGDKAETARKDKDKLVEEVRVLKAKVKGKKGLQTAIENLKLDFAGIGGRMLDAETALAHLEFMWKTVLAKIVESQDQWKNIDNGLAMTTFVGAFQGVLNPWRDIGSLSGDLMKVMDEARAEWKKRYETA
jgi:hypothetical protein